MTNEQRPDKDQHAYDQGDLDLKEVIIDEAIQVQNLIGQKATAELLVKKGINIRTIARVLLAPSQRRKKARRKNNNNKKLPDQIVIQDVSM
ncbi:hypothetical protein [Pseudoduganella violacea]|uniref:Uncharacterized protein n=1 Tax=Pseudoduganella violacea TaxID=1715466 RepID=A0A7W5BFZ6_9BURK|nr:hypothetical protein [Pseudoduganella violacea]MBB3122502.1 hypothetical protein [Pseudoduganella violacea]